MVPFHEYREVSISGVNPNNNKSLSFVIPIAMSDNHDIYDYSYQQSKLSLQIDSMYIPNQPLTNDNQIIANKMVNCRQLRV